MSHLIDELRWRGMIHDISEGTEDHLQAAPRACYIGFDPTAASLHVGSLVPIMLLVHLQRAGHHPIALVGGGTGLIGDPSGKSEERQLLTVEQAAENAEGIRAQLEAFLDFDAAGNPARMRNNHDWLGRETLVEFLRDVGKHFSVNAMLRKESVRRRLENEETGISYTEFSYQLLQAYDFLELHRSEGCTVQAGGSDQWGNITAGIDLIRRATGAQAYGLVSPLVATTAGTKFGKTEAGTVWLDPEVTSPYRFFQFWINCDDRDVVPYLKLFTLLPRDEIDRLEAITADEPHRREAQKALAEDVTRRVHGPDGLERAERASAALFGGDVTGMGGEEIADIFADVPSSSIPRTSLEGEGLDLIGLLAEAGVSPSKGEARRSVEGGGIYVNSRRVEDVGERLTADQAIDGRFVVLRKGKKSYHLLKVEG